MNPVYLKRFNFIQSEPTLSMSLLRYKYKTFDTLWITVGSTFMICKITIAILQNLICLLQNQVINHI